MKTPAQTRAECEAQERRVSASFDTVAAYMARIREQMQRDGLIRDTNARERLGENA